jgi:EPS-associated MarR family transcriptional regulator
MKNKEEHYEDHFKVLRKINEDPNISQRKMAQDLGFSLGKLNYCLKALKKKGFVKLKNFGDKKNKFRYFQHILTTKGLSHRLSLTIYFMKKKMQEYDQLKKEIEKENII